MRAYVTGSRGFIGQNLVETLKARDWEVFEIDPKISETSTVLRGRNWAKVDAFFHLACITQEAAEQNILHSNYVNSFSPLSIAEAARKQGARFVFTSTASVYGQADEIPTPVTAKLKPESVYARQKAAAERRIPWPDLNWSIFRLSNVYGPYQTLENPYCGVIGRFFEQAVAGKPLTVIGDGTQTRDFTFVDDVVDWLIAEVEPQQIFNLSRGEETSIFDLAREIGRIFNHSTTWETIPPRSVDTIDRRCLISDLYCPTSVKDGLFQSADWYLRSSPQAAIVGA